jgi:hypothetical protein
VSPWPCFTKRIVSLYGAETGWEAVNSCCIEAAKLVSRSLLLLGPVSGSGSGSTFPLWLRMWTNPERSTLVSFFL